MSPRRQAIRAGTVGLVHAGRADGSQPFRFFVVFTDAYGPARLQGREVHAMLDGYDVAGILHAIPSALITDDDDRKALTRVICLLSRLASGNGHD